MNNENLHKFSEKDGHIFPFLWVHGEPHEVIYNEIKAIYDCGIKMFCVESRPHPEFCKGEKWWSDFGYILSVAKEFGMKVWLLDDEHFPTGYAVGAVKAHPECKQKNIRAFFMDFYCDGEPVKIIVNDENDDKNVGVFLFERDGDGIDFDGGKEVTNGLNGRILSLKGLKQGFYRIAALFETTRCFELENYIDMLNPDSAELQIKAVYEPTYERCKEFFGNVLVGFFSDEPRFSNGRTESDWMLKTVYQTQVGQIGAAYPFRSDLLELLGVTDKKILVSLWLDIGKAGADFRIEYMNIITRLYRDNFSNKIGKWCRDHGVLYTGHVLEDMGNHTRLGSGAGHFFRSMQGQNIAGIDVVLHQIQRGFSHYKRFYPCPQLYDDPDFFHFTLPKLAVSAAHLEENKKNRAMCEVFGAYGWGESITFMKWLVDFMLVRGINYFVPHAFNPKTNDSDCPPYFYYGGNNPLYPAFKTLMRYTEKLSGALSEDYDVSVAVLYHAEAEWSGLRYRPVDGVARALTENQVDFEIVPSEYLNKTKAKTLIVPFGEYRGCEADKEINDFKGEKIFLTENQTELNEVVENIEREYKLKEKSRDIRILRRGSKFFVFNEGVTTENNTLFYNGKDFNFVLLSGESVLIDTDNYNPKVIEKCEEEISTSCNIFAKRVFEKEFTFIGVGDYTEDLRENVGFEDFCGTVKYDLDFNMADVGSKTVLSVGETDNAVKITLNGKSFDEIIGAPYSLDVSSAVKTGINKLTIELSTTLALYYKDVFSKYCVTSKCGLKSALKILTF